MSIDIENMIRNDGIDLRRAALENDNQAGYIEYNKDTQKFIIVINQNHGIRRQRFTMAHEYAHWQIHHEEIIKKGQMDRDFNREYTYQENGFERQANILAANILMPVDLIRKIMNERNLINNPEGRRIIADILEVSEMALEIQMRGMR